MATSTQTLFGERLNRYDETIVHGTRGFNPRTEKDGRTIVNIHPHKPSGYFTEYTAHLMPKSRKTFIIAGHKAFQSRDEAFAHFKTVSESLRLKYGAPLVDKEFSISFKDGDVEIGLVCTEVDRQSVVYINAFIRKLIERDFPKESRQYRKEHDREIDAL